jgi:hypothetical protein
VKLMMNMETRIVGLGSIPDLSIAVDGVDNLTWIFHERLGDNKISQTSEVMSSKIVFFLDT